MFVSSYTTIICCKEINFFERLYFIEHDTWM